MKLRPFTSIINIAFNYVIKTSTKFNIDESHALRHSMDVFHFANQIYESELYVNPFLKEQKNIIMCSAILHDMCDKKYVDEKVGIHEMNLFMQNYISYEEINVINKIISSMSYSTVKIQGFPNLENYNLAYHIVREADLLAGYDVERCIIYQMAQHCDDYVDSLHKANELFEKRIFRYIDEKLFFTDYSKNMSEILHNSALLKINEINKLYNTYSI
jgi:hypothetical protein